jgi:isopentenyl diphosphate isomerase/L-lactate dehydrogenase-like FMN-dependent dehydrogenase
MRDDKGKLSSRDLAALVVDALCDAGIVKKDDLERAVEVAAEEIEVRKSMGDY